MPQVCEAVGFVAKGGYNQSQRYNFRSVDAVLNQVGPVLAKIGVTPSIRVSNYKLDQFEVKKSESAQQTITRATLLMTVTFYGPDGSSVSSTAAGEAMDYSGDKATNKAMSAAFKYAVTLGLCLPVAESDLDDSDHDEPAVKLASDSRFKTITAAIARAPDSNSLNRIKREVFAQDSGLRDEEVKALDGMISSRRAEVSK